MKTHKNRVLKDPQDFVGSDLLNDLLSSKENPSLYQEAMYKIGSHLAEKLAVDLDMSKSYCLVSTVEDADYLTKGMLDTLKNDLYKIYLACFWNDRKKVGGQSVAPIINSYLEPGYEQANELIVVKSIMAGSCVVKTNISTLISKVDPQKINVVAPVMYKDSQNSLEKEFPKKVSNLFRYWSLAEDQQLDDNQNVMPGIGGSVYELLGFKGKDDKNRYLPQIVKQRAFA